MDNNTDNPTYINNDYLGNAASDSPDLVERYATQCDTFLVARALSNILADTVSWCKNIFMSDVDYIYGKSPYFLQERDLSASFISEHKGTDYNFGQSSFVDTIVSGVELIAEIEVLLATNFVEAYQYAGCDGIDSRQLITDLETYYQDRLAVLADNVCKDMGKNVAFTLYWNQIQLSDNLRSTLSYLSSSQCLFKGTLSINISDRMTRNS